MIDQRKFFRVVTKLFGKWVVVTSLGGSLVYIISLFLNNTFIGAERCCDDVWKSLILGGLISGGLVGISQQWLFSGIWPMIDYYWVFATAAGWGFGMVVVNIFMNNIGILGSLSDLERILVFILGAGFAGMAAGILSWVELRKRLARSEWWLMGSAVGWVLAMVSVFAFAWKYFPDAEVIGGIFVEMSWFGVAAGFIGGMFIGIETGIAVFGLLAQQEWEKLNFPTRR